MPLIWEGEANFSKLRPRQRKALRIDLIGALRKMPDDIEDDDRDAMVALLQKSKKKKEDVMEKAGGKQFMATAFKTQGTIFLLLLPTQIS